MNNTEEINSICVQVFAKASAAISHEIKNTLSIINENAGLLDDLAGMAEPDGGVPPERVQAAVSTIMRQVARSNEIMKNLNRFAHSADTPLARSNLEETLLLAVALTARQAAMKGVTVKVECSSNLVVQTYLFALEALLYLTLCRIYWSVEAGAVISLQVIEESPYVIINLAAVNPTALQVAGYPDEEEAVLLERVQGNCLYQNHSLSLTFPANIEL